MVKIDGGKVTMAIANRSMKVTEFTTSACISPQTFYNVLRRGACTTEVAGKIAYALGVMVEDIVEKEG